MQQCKYRECVQEEHIVKYTDEMEVNKYTLLFS